MTDDVIAERAFRMADGPSIKVRFLRPSPVGADRGCEVVFAGGMDRRKTIHGVDAVQALWLALQFAGAELYAHEPAVHWFEPGDDLGLPTSQSIGDVRLARTHEVSVRPMTEREDIAAAFQQLRNDIEASHGVDPDFDWKAAVHEGRE